MQYHCIYLHVFLIISGRGVRSRELIEKGGSIAIYDGELVSDEDGAKRESHGESGFRFFCQMIMAKIGGKLFNHTFIRLAYLHGCWFFLFK